MTPVPLPAGYEGGKEQGKEPRSQGHAALLWSRWAAMWGVSTGPLPSTPRLEMGTPRLSRS